MENTNNTNPNVEEPNVNETEQANSVTYNEEEVRELLQRETDKRVSDALRRQERMFLKKMAEADKLASMDEAQRKQYEFENRVKELEEKEKEFNLMRNKVEAQKVLASRSLPIEFVDYIVAEDADTMMERITTFEKNFNAAVNDAVSKKLASPTPKASTVSQKGLDREQFQKMTLAQQSELFRTNPTLFKELSSR